MSIKKYQIKVNIVAVVVSRSGYNQLTLALHCLHFHLLKIQEKSGIKSSACNNLLQLPQWLLQVIIHHSHDLSLYIITEAKLQNNSQNTKSIIKKNICIIKLDYKFNMRFSS